MKKILSILLVLSIDFMYAQNTDLVLRATITPEYVHYLQDELVACCQIIATPPSDSAEMKAYAKRMFIDLSLIHCEVDSFLQKGKTIHDSLYAITQRLDKVYNSNIATLNIENSKLFFDDLLKLFKDPKYGQFKNDLDKMSKNYESVLHDLGSHSERLLNYMTNKLQQIKDDGDVLGHTDVQFNLRIQVYGRGFEEYMNFSQIQFREIDSIIDLCDQSINSLELASEQFVSFQNGDTLSAEMIHSLKTSITYFSLGLDSVLQLLHTNPVSLLKLNTSWILDTKEYLNDLSDILDGKTYYTGGENIKIRPISLLEHPIDDWGKILFDFYRTGNRYSYTFGELFPDALPASLVNKLKEDMVINVSDNEEKMNSRMLELRDMYLDKLLHGQDNSTNNMGVAFTQTYLYMVEMNKEIKSFAKYIENGNYRKGFEFIAMHNKSLKDSISHYYNKASNDWELSFTILVITHTQTQSYTVNSSTNFFPMFISYSTIPHLTTLSSELEYTVNNLRNDLENMYHDLDNMFNMSLDPNYLDFSSVKLPLDVILVFEKSNPDFLDITPHGITKMQDMRVTMRKEFSKYAENISNMNKYLDSLAIWREDYNIDDHEINTSVSRLNSFVQDVNTDIQQPDSTTIINDVKVNLSAWFDNPPQDLLLKLKWFFDNDSTTDNTLGGFFPDGNPISSVQECTLKPNAYLLSQNYPNPFNPKTMIQFILSKPSFVSIKIYDLLGREVEALVSEMMPAGKYVREWNPRGLTSGIYVYQLKTGTYTDTKKMILLK